MVSNNGKNTTTLFLNHQPKKQREQAIKMDSPAKYHAKNDKNHPLNGLILKQSRIPLVLVKKTPIL